MKNIEYKSEQISEYYSCNRQTWDEFYPSERWVFERIYKGRKNLGDVLDVGCACGGLGSAIAGNLKIDSYTGIDINKKAIAWAMENQKLPVPNNFIHGDMLNIHLEKKYETVVSLSCADWNIKTHEIVDACWEKLKPNGYFVISLRLTPEKGVNNIKNSYQHINFSESKKNPEIANYAVFNFREALTLFKQLQPTPVVIGCYGYWGKPSATAVTPFEKLVFAVFYIRKGAGNSAADIMTELRLPIDIFLKRSR